MKSQGGPYVTRSEMLVAGRQIFSQFSHSIRSAISDQNILAVFMVLTGLGMLRRSSGIPEAIEQWSAGVITSEVLALLFVIAGVYAFNRRLGDREMLAVIIPLIIYVVAGIILAFVRPGVPFSPALLVAGYLTSTYRRIVSDGE